MKVKGNGGRRISPPQATGLQSGRGFISRIALFVLKEIPRKKSARAQSEREQSSRANYVCAPFPPRRKQRPQLAGAPTCWGLNCVEAFPGFFPWNIHRAQRPVTGRHPLHLVSRHISKQNRKCIGHRIMNTEIGELHRRERRKRRAEDAEFSAYFSALSAPLR